MNTWKMILQLILKKLAKEYLKNLVGNLFIIHSLCHLFSKESSTEFPILHECFEEFQDFIENECPKMLLEVYENAS